MNQVKYPLCDQPDKRMPFMDLMYNSLVDSRCNALATAKAKEAQIMKLPMKTKLRTPTQVTCTE